MKFREEINAEKPEKTNNTKSRKITGIKSWFLK